MKNIDNIYDQTQKNLQERKRRILRGEPPDKDIEVDLFIQDCYTSPTYLTPEELKELTGQ